MATPDVGAGWSLEEARRFAEWVAPLSNWGRWGSDDELGTLNLLTPEATLRGLACASTGRVVPLGREITTAHAVDNPTPMLRLMKASGDAAAAVGGSHASEWVGLAHHGFAVTHIDAHAHQFFDGSAYNGRPAGEVSTRSGARSGSVVPLATAGIAGRGVLLDAPRATGRAWLEPGDALGPAHLDAIAADHGVTVGAGDLVLLRTGREARAREHGALDPLRDGSPGLDAEALRWLREHDVALLGTDVQADVMRPGGAPHPMPVHAGALVHLGLPLLDNVALDALAEACAERGRWDFLLVVAPLPLERCTGSPVSPIAVL